MVHFSRPFQPGAWPLLLGERGVGETLQRWLYRVLRQAVAEGRLAPGTALPASRVLARQLQVARGTVTAVYDQLLAEGYVLARRGSATVVNPRLPDDWRIAGPPAPAAGRARGPTFEPATALARTVARRGTPFPLAPAPGEPLPLTPHLCDFRSFPLETWRRLQSRQLRPSRIGLLGDAPAQGLPSLRRAVAGHLARARGLVVDPEQVVVLASVQQALDLALRLLVAPGEAVWMEDPGYPAARRVIEAAGARAVDVPIDAEGIDVERGRRLAPDARLAYVTPARQAPLGVPLAPPRRHRLLAWASARDAHVFEDDYDSEFRFNARPVPPLKTADGADRVFLAGSFGKLTFPGLRLSWVVPPAALLAPFVAALSVTARHPNAVLQATLAEFIEDGDLDRHVRRMRRHYAARAEALAQAARRHWAGWLQLPAVPAGLDVTAAFLGAADDVSAARRLRAAGLGPRPLRDYTASCPMPPALVMGFAALDEDIIEAAAIQVARVLGRAVPSLGGRVPPGLI